MVAKQIFIRTQKCKLGCYKALESTLEMGLKVFRRRCEIAAGAAPFSPGWYYQ
jgi:hypothetical protein